MIPRRKMLSTHPDRRTSSQQRLAKLDRLRCANRLSGVGACPVIEIALLGFDRAALAQRGLWLIEDRLPAFYAALKPPAQYPNRANLANFRAGNWADSRGHDLALASWWGEMMVASYAFRPA